MGRNYVGLLRNFHNHYRRKIGLNEQRVKLLIASAESARSEADRVPIHYRSSEWKIEINDIGERGEEVGKKRRKGSEKAKEEKEAKKLGVLVYGELTCRFRDFSEASRK